MAAGHHRTLWTEITIFFAHYKARQGAGLVIGIAAALAIGFADPPQGLSGAAWTTVAIAALMAIWWASEALPIPVTALVPILLFPLLDVATLAGAIEPYFHPLLLLFLGGFVLALAIERWGLHRRLGLRLIAAVGRSPGLMIAGAMAATALASMWILNTASTIMMLPIAISLIQLVEEEGESAGGFGPALLLGIAYAASAGGISTLIGTAPNAMLAAFLEETYGYELGFAQWMLIGVPVAACLVPLIWVIVTKIAFTIDIPNWPAHAAHLKGLARSLPEMSTPEKRVAGVFLLVVILWFTRPLLQEVPGLGWLNDRVIAMIGAFLVLVIPSGRALDRDGTEGRLLPFAEVKYAQWGVLILFGGGLSLAAAVTATGLSDWIGNAFAAFGDLAPVLFMLIVIAIVVFLTELTSNTATTAALLPLVAALAEGMGADVFSLIAPVAMAASCAFMLPVATPPNAIVFSSGAVSVPQMIRAGFFGNVIAIGVLTAAAAWLVPAVFSP